MPSVTSPVQHAARPVTGAWTVLPSWFPVPDMGALPINAFLLKGPEPLLVDTGLGALGEDFVTELSREIDLEDLRWIWLSHTDADHIGNLNRVLEMAPKAKVVSNFLGAGKMGMMGAYDLSRVHILAPDEVFEVGGRRLHQVKPPYYDAPETMGFFDETDRVLFAADAFGALLPGSAADIAEFSDDTLRDGLVGWSSIDAPWLAQMDQAALGRMIADLERMQPDHVFSGHLPLARGVEPLTRHIAGAYCRGTTEAATDAAAEAVETVFT
jgi:glyoxylase-like metal-dependent hydrolase (beta-lactamase superfamily II)